MITTVDLGVLLLIGVSAVFFAWLSRRCAFQGWAERRFGWLFPAKMARSMEAIALERPANYLAIQFFMMVGALSMANELGLIQLGPLLRYGMAIILAAFALDTARVSGRWRAAQSVT